MDNVEFESADRGLGNASLDLHVRPTKELIAQGNGFASGVGSKLQRSRIRELGLKQNEIGRCLIGRYKEGYIGGSKNRDPKAGWPESPDIYLFSKRTTEGDRG